MIKEEEIRFDFDINKAIEIIIYFARRVNEPTILRIFKMVYLAEKLHLERYGVQLCNDRFDALPYGPAPRNMYDIINEARYQDDYGFRVEGRDIEALRAENRGHISEATKTCLDEVLEQYGNLPIGRLVDVSHDRIWSKAWNARGVARRIEIPLESIVAQLKKWRRDPGIFEERRVVTWHGRACWKPFVGTRARIAESFQRPSINMC